MTVSSDIVKTIAQQFARLKRLEANVPNARWFLAVPTNMRQHFGDEVVLPDGIRLPVRTDPEAEERAVGDHYEADIILTHKCDDCDSGPTCDHSVCWRRTS